MKRDMKLIQMILESLEGETGLPLPRRGAEREKLNYHKALCYREGLVFVDEDFATDWESLTLVALTWKGHNVLARLRGEGAQSVQVVTTQVFDDKDHSF